MYHGTCVTHMPWCMSGSLARGGGENVSGIPAACANRNFTYLNLIRGPMECMPEWSLNIFQVVELIMRVFQWHARLEHTGTTQTRSVWIVLWERIKPWTTRPAVLLVWLEPLLPLQGPLQHHNVLVSTVYSKCFADVFLWNTHKMSLSLPVVQVLGSFVYFKSYVCAAFVVVECNIGILERGNTAFMWYWST